MKKIVLALLSIAVVTTGICQETREERRCRRGLAAGYATRDATVLSMMGWGVAIFAGIATICALYSNEEASTSSTTTSH